MIRTDTLRWRQYLIEVNPDPWAVGPLSVGRSKGKLYPMMGRNDQLWAYQQSIKYELQGEPMLLDDWFAYEWLSLEFWFWRQIDGPKMWADVTNLQKGTEDALQGVLFDNDRRVRHVTSTMVEQAADSPFRVAIRCSPWTPDDVVLPANEMDWRGATPAPLDNTWGGPQ